MIANDMIANNVTANNLTANDLTANNMMAIDTGAAFWHIGVCIKRGLGPPTSPDRATVAKRCGSGRYPAQNKRSS